MQELYTKAFVLDKIPIGESDELITLYTKEYGKIRARAKSIRKITSKVSAHIQPLAFTYIRFMRRTGAHESFFVLDAIREPGQRELEKKTVRSRVAQLLQEMTHEWEKDDALWKFLENIKDTTQNEPEIQKKLLEILGFNASHAHCALCGNIPVFTFVVQSQVFLCMSCASKNNKNKVVYIE